MLHELEIDWKGTEYNKEYKLIITKVSISVLLRKISISADVC